MNANVWQFISMIGFSLSGIVLIVTIFICIKYQIFSVIGDLSGRTASKQIKAIREQNVSNGDKYHRPDAYDVSRSTLKSTLTKNSRKLGKTQSDSGSLQPRPSFTGVLNDDSTNGNSTQVLGKPEESINNATQLLNNIVNTTEDYIVDTAENDIGNTTEKDSETATEVLNNEEFEIVKVILDVHSKETIS